MGKQRLTASEATDRHGRLLLVAITTSSIMLFSNAVEDVAEPPLVDAMKALQLVLVIAMIAALIPVVFWKAYNLRRLPEDERKQYFAHDSFIMHAFRRAWIMSWAAGIIALAALGPVSKHFADMPAGFFFDVALGIMVGVFGVAALILSR